MAPNFDFTTYARTITSEQGQIVGWVSYDDTEEGYYCGGLYIQDTYRNRGYGRAAIQELRKIITKPLLLVGAYPIALLLDTSCAQRDGDWFVLPVRVQSDSGRTPR